MIDHSDCTPFVLIAAAHAFALGETILSGIDRRDEADAIVGATEEAAECFRHAAALVDDSGASDECRASVEERVRDAVDEAEDFGNAYRAD